MREGHSAYYSVSVSSKEPILAPRYVLASDWNDESITRIITIYKLVDGVVAPDRVRHCSLTSRKDGLVYNLRDTPFPIANLKGYYIDAEVWLSKFKVLSDELKQADNKTEVNLWDTKSYIHVGTAPKSDIKIIKEDQMSTVDKTPPYGMELQEVRYDIYYYYIVPSNGEDVDLWEITYSGDYEYPLLQYIATVYFNDVELSNASVIVQDPADGRKVEYKYETQPKDKSSAPSEAPVNPVTPKEIWCDTLFDFKVLQWAEERNLLAGGTVDGQFQKLVEELGELARALARNDVEEVRDSIGDMDVVLTILAKQLGVTRSECREAAYNEIKDRKGTMCGGVFIKD